MRCAHLDKPCKKKATRFFLASRGPWVYPRCDKHAQDAFIKLMCMKDDQVYTPGNSIEGISRAIAAIECNEVTYEEAVVMEIHNS